MYADEIRRAVETATRLTLPTVTALLWRAYGEGKVTEAEAEALSVLIEARQVSAKSGENFAAPQRLLSIVSRSGVGILESEEAPQDSQRSPRTGVGSRPRTDASLERRRCWAASGRLPPALAAKFTTAEQATLALIAAETARKGDCRLAIEHLAAVAGVSRSTVKNALREARKLGLLIVEERRVTAFRNLPNIVRIVSPEWTAWLRLERKGVTDRAPLGSRGVAERDPLDRDGITRRYPIASKGVANHHLPQGGGVKFSTGTPTQASRPLKDGSRLSKSGCSARRGSPA